MFGFFNQPLPWSHDCESESERASVYQSCKVLTSVHGKKSWLGSYSMIRWQRMLHHPRGNRHGNRKNVSGQRHMSDCFHDRLLWRWGFPFLMGYMCSSLVVFHTMVRCHRALVWPSLCYIYRPLRHDDIWRHYPISWCASWIFMIDFHWKQKIHIRLKWMLNVLWIWSQTPNHRGS